jgi:archaellum component FlaF (FlaF/FlaG flagellin family)
MLEKHKIVDLIEIMENGTVQVRTKTAILENGKQISATHERHLIEPGQNYSAEDARVQAICAATHTAAVVSAYQAAQAAREI